jgi:hypothetical protein
MSVTRKYTCQYCNAGFNDRSNKYRHENKYCKNMVASLSSPALASSLLRKKIKVKVKEVKSDNVLNHDILEELNALRERVSKIENEPRYNNWIIVGLDMYNDMISRYGREEAVSFLTKSAVTGDSLDVIKKLYLDGVSPEKYPIACRNYHHFRYLNDKREVIDDNGGSSVQKLFTSRAHKAMILATNEMIAQQIASGSTDLLYRENEIGNVQECLTMVHNIDIDRLAGMINNPNHPFFKDTEETKHIFTQ